MMRITRLHQGMSPCPSCNRLIHNFDLMLHGATTFISVKFCVACDWLTPRPC